MHHPWPSLSAQSSHVSLTSNKLVGYFFAANVSFNFLIESSSSVCREKGREKKGGWLHTYVHHLHCKYRFRKWGPYMDDLYVLYIRIYIRTCMHACMRTYVHAYIHTYIHTVHTYAHTHARTHAHTHARTPAHTHTYIHTYIHMR